MKKNIAKIKFSLWKECIPFNKLQSGYQVEGTKIWRTTSEHGRSKGEVECPCCDTATEIYFWSFSGSGKRCRGCNVMLGRFGAYIDFTEMTNEIVVTPTYFVRN